MPSLVQESVTMELIVNSALQQLSSLTLKASNKDNAAKLEKVSTTRCPSSGNIYVIADK